MSEYAGTFLYVTQCEDWGDGAEWNGDYDVYKFNQRNVKKQSKVMVQRMVDDPKITAVELTRRVYDDENSLVDERVVMKVTRQELVDKGVIKEAVV